MNTINTSTSGLTNYELPVLRAGTTTGTQSTISLADLFAGLGSVTQPTEQKPLTVATTAVPLSFVSKIFDGLLDVVTKLVDTVLSLAVGSKETSASEAAEGAAETKGSWFDSVLENIFGSEETAEKIVDAGKWIWDKGSSALGKVGSWLGKAASWVGKLF